MRGGKGEVMKSHESSAQYEAFCATCQISKTFLTPQGINFFRISHEGHNIEIRQPEEAVEAIEREPSIVAETPLKVTPPKKKAPSHSQREPSKDTIELKKLSVDLDNSEGQDAFRVIGFSGNFHTFVRTFPLNEVSEAQKFIEGGVHVDEYGNEFFWRQEVVEAALQVKDLMNINKTPEDLVQAQISAEEVVKADEAKMEEAKPEPKQAPIEPPEPPQPPQPKPQPKKPAKEEAPEPKQTPKEEPSPQPEPAPPAPKDTKKRLLLVGKAAHIQEGEEYGQEALRISKALGQFRWNIEAPYVIGALFEDIVSIQAQAGPITKDVIEKVEDLGYRFIAVDAPGGRVTAWFKKVGEGDEESGGSSAAEYAKLGAFRGAFSLGGDQPRTKDKGEKFQS